MKRILILMGLAAMLLLGVAAPASASIRSDVDDFTFDSFEAVYTLTRDEDGRSVMEVEETLVADFPPEQNRGIRRELVERYDGHPTDIEVLSVTDETGEPREYESESDDEFFVLTIAGDDFVEGRQTYVITYEQHNVTRYFSDTDAEEFYWDVNGTGWNQPFDTVNATIVLEDDLQGALTGETDAVAGSAGSESSAMISETDDGFTVSAENLGPRENLTFAIGFEPGTFVPRDSSFTGAPWPSLSFAAAVIAIGAAIGAFVLRMTRLRDAPGRGVIVAEYLPPKNANVLTSSVILGKQSKATTAQILALAIAGNLRIVEEPERKTKDKYRLDFMNADGVDDDGSEFLHAIFGATLTPGEHRELAETDAKATKGITALMSKVTARTTSGGLRRPLPTGLIALVVGVGLVAAVLVVVFAAISLVGAYGGVLPGVLIGVAVITGFLVVASVSKHPLTAKGVELRDHLAGLREYITVAEADRIRFLQSPEGASRKPVAVDDPAQIVRINERLLPYAVLFGVEKKWAEEIGRYYERTGTSPYWYNGSTPFTAAVLASSVGSVSTSVASSYSASSGGSAGGASSGGGGGGGGGGGV